MKNLNFNELNKKLKSNLKRKVSITQKTMIAFLITGIMGENAFAFSPVAPDYNYTTGTRQIGSGGLHNISLGNEGSVNSNSSIVIGKNVTTWTDGNGGLSHHLLVLGEEIRGFNGGYSIIVGNSAGIEGSGDYNFSMGTYAGDARKGTYIFSYGEGAGHQSNTLYNFAFGKEAGRKIFGKENDYNFAFGFQAGQDLRLHANGKGGNNIHLMNGAGNQTTGSYNMAVGFQAGQLTNGHYNYAFGAQSGKSVTGDENYALGNHAGKNVIGNKNYALGINAGNNIAGSGNIAFGENAGQNVKGLSTATTPNWIEGNSNVAIGKEAGVNVISNQSLALGYKTGNYVGYRYWDNTTKDFTLTTPIEYIRASEIDPKSQKKTGAEHNTAVGANSGNNIAGQDNVAVGENVGNLIDGKADGGAGNVGIGRNTGSKIYGNANIAIGENSANGINGSNNIAMGTLSSNTTGKMVEKENTISFGTKADASKNDAIAIGHGAKATAEKAISIGTGNVVSGEKSGAIGDPSYVSGTGTYTIGNDNGTDTDKIVANNAGIFGNNNKMTVDAEASRIIGNTNNVTATNTFVIGNNVTGDIASSVYLGHESKGFGSKIDSTAGMTTYATATVDGLALNFAGKTPTGIVTVGDVGKERRVQNVAAGLISETSTDAINGYFML